MSQTAVCAYQRFIIIDDDRINNIVSKFVVLKYCKDADLHIYTDPEAALSYIQEINNDSLDQLNTLVFLDINMPRISGWEFLEALGQTNLSRTKQFTIFITSSSIDPSDIKRAQDHALVSGFFSKPLTFEHLNKI
ncbi:response regulator [Dyadobacter sp. CY345]|uniref:response regulator n=1 Tax=Dyadobacter sp. CY345 TaxID=2909335 RepID=UPI001F4452DE|nr:response regulator [Dyadobacter sp. CY345]MCF2443443.1 response regulator [Dyadobacter sp. CY345]